MKAELTLPPELIDLIVNKLLEGLKPLLSKTDKSEDDIIFDVIGLSKYLGVTSKWIYEQTCLKTIPYLKLNNKRLRFKKKDIDKWLDIHKIPAVSELRGKFRLIK